MKLIILNSIDNFTHFRQSEISQRIIIWIGCIDEDTKRKKKISRAKQWLNTSAVQAMTPALLDQQDPDGDVRSWFSTISQLLDSSLQQS